MCSFPDVTPSLVEQGPTSPIPTTAMPAPFREETKEPIEDITPPDDRLPSYNTAVDEPLGSSRRPIEVTSDDDDEQGDALPTENPNLLQVPKRRRTIRAS